MAKKTKEPRTLTCAFSGETFTYSGRGRPPKVDPARKAEYLASKRKTIKAAA